MADFSRIEKLNEEQELLDLDKEIDRMIQENMELRARLIEHIAKENEEVSDSDLNVEDGFHECDDDKSDIDNGSEYGMGNLVLSDFEEEQSDEKEQKESDVVNVSIVKNNTTKKTGCFVCLQCNKSFTIKPILQNHIRTHTGERPFACNKCDMKFKQSTHRNTHIRTVHNGERPYECDQCDMKFGESGSRNRHIRAVHNGPYECDQCDMKFSESGHRNNHIRTVHKEKRSYWCDICQQTFTGCNLDIHVRTVHNDEKNFKCDHCGKGFARKEHLSEHKLIHENSKSFPCDICEKPFRLLRQVKVHRKTHLSPTEKKGEKNDKKSKK